MDYCKEIIELENKGELREAGILSYEIWRSDRSQKNLLNAALEIWYILFHDEMLGLDIPPNDVLYDCWTDVLSEINSKLDGDAELMFYSGYMMMIGFYLFDGAAYGVSVEDIPDYGISLMEKAFKTDPNDAVFAIQHIRNEYENEDYAFCLSECRKTAEMHSSDIRARFSGGGMINDYFLDIFLDC